MKQRGNRHLVNTTRVVFCRQNSHVDLGNNQPATKTRNVYEQGAHFVRLYRF